ncbi:MAG: glutamate--tRNA ligase [Planctomycetota bacterium]|nr:MAG: glutamate--tRNA ligase [Planctomycetota bacterium]
MVVTRFAPSPTGYLHIGGARTALFNWLLARKTGGKFLLRIEDTDQKRNTPAAARQVMEDLRWLGIEWDEGPEVGGPNGPYFQSQRKDLYDKYIKQLIDENKAYYCFDAPEELQQMREKAQAEKRNLIYPRPEEFPDEGDVKKARAQGRPVTVRFAMPAEADIVVNDVVRGEVKFAASEISDFIIQKSDGFPTYHFACVVDDELMGVTHVIRGQEHLMNTPNHQALQDALGFRRPIYAHMSVTVSESGGKLSKRERPKALHKAIKEMPDIDIAKLAGIAKISDNELKHFINRGVSPPMAAIDAMAEYLGVHLPEINVVDFFKSGYLPEAVVNFLALLGWNPGDEREIMQLDELISAFDLGRLTKANSLFDRQKLIAFNTEHIRMVSDDKLLAHFKDYLKAVGSAAAGADDALLARLIQINAGARTLADIEKKSRFIFIDNDEIQYDEKAVKKVLLKHDGLTILRLVGERLAKLDEITPATIEELLRGMAEERQVGLGKVAQPLRVAICGTTISPPIFDSVDILGIKDTLRRIENALKKFGI